MYFQLYFKSVFVLQKFLNIIPMEPCTQLAPNYHQNLPFPFSYLFFASWLAQFLCPELSDVGLLPPHLKGFSLMFRHWLRKKGGFETGGLAAEQWLRHPCIFFACCGGKE